MNRPAKTGAFNYNLIHRNAIAMAVGVAGLFFANNYLVLAGAVLFGHPAMDRMLGIGLKYNKGYKFTYPGEVGAQQKPEHALGAA